MPLRDGFFSTATQTSCCNRIQRSNRVRLLVVSTHDFPDKVYYTAALSPLCRVWEISYRFMLCAGRPASLLLDKTPLDIMQEGATRAFIPYHRTKAEGGCATFRFSLGD